MRDTSPQMDEKVREIIRKKSPYERLKMGCSMMATSKQLIIRAILEKNPTISAKDLKQEFFLSFYGNEFTQIEKDKILTHLKRC